MIKHLILAIMLLSVSAAFAIPQQINYQGQLTDSSGAPLDTTVGITFRIYDAPVGGTNLWTETHPSVTVTDRLFQVQLGSITTLTDLFSANRWLGITVGNNTEMSPRQQVVSVAHAYRVGTVDGASGGMITGDVNITGKANIGTGNTNSGTSAFVTGNVNAASGNFSAIGGGQSHIASGHANVIAGGDNNDASGICATVGGG